jgi:nucleotide-binding universal stress UspA family protein
LEYRLLEATEQVMAAEMRDLLVAYCRRDAVPSSSGTPVIDIAGLQVDALVAQAVKDSWDIKDRLSDWARQRNYAFEKEKQQKGNRCVRFCEHVGEPLERVMRIGRLSDLIICSKTHDATTISRQMLETCILKTGKPVLAVPAHAPRRLLQHVLIAWDGSLAASRLVGQILPILRLTEKVSIFSFPERNCHPDQALNLQEYLSCHDITAKVAIAREDGPIGDALVSTTIAEDVTLVAMGAYGHGRTREIAFGGLTRYMLAKGSIPLLLAH